MFLLIYLWSNILFKLTFIIFVVIDLSIVGKMLLLNINGNIQPNSYSDTFVLADES